MQQLNTVRLQHVVGIAYNLVKRLWIYAEWQVSGFCETTKEIVQFVPWIFFGRQPTCFI